MVLGDAAHRIFHRRKDVACRIFHRSLGRKVCAERVRSFLRV